MHVQLRSCAAVRAPVHGNNWLKQLRLCASHNPPLLPVHAGASNTPRAPSGRGMDHSTVLDSVLAGVQATPTTRVMSLRNRCVVRCMEDEDGL